MKPLTDQEKKLIVADYVECGNYSEVARRHGFSRNTIKNAVLADSEFAEKCQVKKKQDTKDILKYMDSKKTRVCEFIDKYLEAMLDPEKIKKATVNQLSTAFGTVIDKFTKNTEKEGDTSLMQELLKVMQGDGEPQ